MMGLTKLQQEALLNPAREPAEVPSVAARRSYCGNIRVLLATHIGDY